MNSSDGVERVTFDEFQEVNALRCATKFPSCDDWTLNDWAVALSGEVGELCNILKKNRRGDKAYSLEGAHGPATRREILKELADVITYADLMMTKLGANTRIELVDKFDEVSKRVGFERAKSVTSSPEQEAEIESSEGI